MSVRLRRQVARGFTLVELMIVVAIIGVLSAVAIPAFGKYIRRSKSAEAGANLGKIVHGAIAYFDADHASKSGAMLPRCMPGNGAIFNSIGTTAALPTTGCCPQKCSPNQTGANKANWGGAGWKALSFAINDPHYYKYAFAGKCCPASGACNNVVFTASAVGDLNCDSVTSLFTRQGKTSAGEIRTSALFVNPAKEIE